MEIDKSLMTALESARMSLFELNLVNDSIIVYGKCFNFFLNTQKIDPLPQPTQKLLQSIDPQDRDSLANAFFTGIERSRTSPRRLQTAKIAFCQLNGFGLMVPWFYSDHSNCELLIGTIQDITTEQAMRNDINMMTRGLLARSMHQSMLARIGRAVLTGQKLNEIIALTLEQLSTLVESKRVALFALVKVKANPECKKRVWAGLVLIPFLRQN